jgi:adenylate cyclase
MTPNGRPSAAQAPRHTARHAAWRQLAAGVGALRKRACLYLPARIPVAVKLAVSIGLLVTLGMSLLGAVVIQNQTRLLGSNMHTFGETVVRQMAESAKEPLLANDGLQLDVLASNLANGENVVGTAIYSADRTRMASAGISPFQQGAPYAGHERPFLDGTPQTLSWQWNDSPRGDVDAVSFFSPVRFRDMTVGYVQIAFSRSLLTQSTHDAVRSIIVATLLLVVLGAIISYVMGRRLSRPLHHLMHASQAIGNGQYHYRIAERRNDELGYLMDAFNNMAQGLLQKAQVEDAFARYVPSNVAREILSGLEQVELQGRQVQASVMFVDIVGFTAKSETMRPEGVAELLNEFYTEISRAAALYRGTVDKYMGDAAMLVFGVPDSDQDHVFHAITCAVFFQKLMSRINMSRLARGKFPVQFRIGINSGEMLAGVMGSEDRKQYTVVGDSVNLASRLCSVATADQIVITEETYNYGDLRHKLVATRLDSIRIRGKSKPVNTYLVHDVNERHHPEMERLLVEVLGQERT